MEGIEKVKNYLRNSGYSENRINKIISNPKYCNAIYNQIVAYERLVAEDNLNKGKTR